MIKYVTGINDNYVLSFRLLNSEIGNDLKERKVIHMKENMSFRLLNSEIGNDPKN